MRASTPGLERPPDVLLPRCNPPHNPRYQAPREASSETDQTPQADPKPTQTSHVGESDITNFILLSRARQALTTPFIASGGFADGQGLAAALCLGAAGINMGTRFMCTAEAPIHQNIKETIVGAQETDTALVLRRWRNTTRLYRNRVTDEALRVERESERGEFAEVAPLVSGARGRQVFVNGDPEYGVSDPYPWTTLEDEHDALPRVVAPDVHLGVFRGCVLTS